MGIERVWEVIGAGAGRVGVDRVCCQCRAFLMGVPKQEGFFLQPRR